MTIDEAFQLLGLTATSTENERFSVYEETRDRLEGKMVKAPTPGLKEKYRESLRQMEEAIEVVEGSLDGGDLPTVSASIDRQAETPAIETPVPQTADAPRLQPTGRKSKSTELIIMAVVVAIVAIGGGWFLLNQQTQKAEQAAVDNFLLNVTRGRIEEVKIALESSLPLDVNQRDNNDNSALYIAIDKGHVEVVRLLLEDPGVNPNAREGSTYLIGHALSSDNSELFEVFVKSQKVDVNFFYILRYAAESDDLDAVKSLVSRGGIHVNQYTSALHRAAYNGNEQIVELLLSNPGIDVNDRDGDSRNPLYWAAARGHEKVLRQLLSHPEIDVNVRSDCCSGERPLHAAVKSGDEQVVALLASHPDIDINAMEYAKTPLNMALDSGNEKIVRILRAAGASE